MTINSISSPIVQGLNQSLNQMNSGASTIASATTLQGPENQAKEDVVRTLVGLQENNRYFQTSARIFSTQSRLGKYLNETA
jgi:hypothetical protein